MTLTVTDSAGTSINRVFTGQTVSNNGGPSATQDQLVPIGAYYEVASDGGVFSFGAPFRGAMAGGHLTAPVVGMAVTKDEGGYWLVASDGGVFCFGDAGFHGSAGNQSLSSKIVGMAATSDGAGYWQVAANGAVFTYGDAVNDGSMAGKHLNQPIVGMASARGGGYYLVAADGGVLASGRPSSARWPAST